MKCGNCGDELAPVGAIVTGNSHINEDGKPCSLCDECCLEWKADGHGIHLPSKTCRR